MPNPEDGKNKTRSQHFLVAACAVLLLICVGQSIYGAVLAARSREFPIAIGTALLSFGALMGFSPIWRPSELLHASHRDFLRGRSLTPRISVIVLVALLLYSLVESYMVWFIRHHPEASPVSA